jgi:hypothetical protein
VRQGQIEFHPIAGHTAIVAGELEELAADAFDVTDIRRATHSRSRGLTRTRA